MPVKPRIKFAPGKTYVYSGTEGTYSVIAGELLEGDSVAAGGNLQHGNGAPSNTDGKDGDVYIDLNNFKVHTKSGGAWGTGAVFKGSDGAAGSAGTNGKSVHFGNGAPGAGLGGDLDVYLDLTDFKLHTKSGGSWSAGSAFKGSSGTAGANGKSIKWGAGAPSSSPGADDDLYFDITNFHVYPKTSGSWDSANKQLFKGATGSSGSKGDAGAAGNTIHQGSGTPLSGTGVDGDTFLDTTNHVIYKKSAGAWASQGSSFKGSNGSNGSNGADGAGVNKYSSALTADTYLSTGTTASTATTAGSAAYPATLNLTDPMENVGGVVTRSSVTYNRNGTGATATGSRFTIAAAGRYKIDYFATFNVTASTSSLNSVNLNASIYYSTDSGSTWTSLQTQTATFNTSSTTTAQTTLELSKSAFFPANALVEFRASRGLSDVSTVVSVNAVTKAEVGDDTFVVITKL